MKFCWVTVLVKDLEQSLKFYEEIIGLPVSKRFKAGPDTEIAFLGEEGTRVELISTGKIENTNMGSDISLGFEVESVDQMMESLKEKGIKIDSGPFQPNQNIKFFYVLDPNGLKVQLVENITH